jgi:membrane-bound metal-dependent hydrolase YbcI (DUF457 family)
MPEAPSAGAVGDQRGGRLDLFTHMLIGYLIGWLAAFTATGYNEYLILLPVVMAMLPDFDFVLYAVPRRVRRRFRGIKHRGISHTVVFLAASALVVAYIFSALVGTPLLAGVALAFLGGISHVLLDGLTSFAFPYLGPFSWRERSLDLDGAVTWYMVPFSLFSIATMWGMRAYAFPFSTYTLFVTFVFSAIAAHYIARLAVKLYVERVVYRGQWARVNPSFRLLSFYVMKKRNVAGVNITEYDFTRLPRTRKQESRTYLELDRLPADGAGIDRPRDTYEAVLASSRALVPGGRPNIASPANLGVKPLPSENGEWKLFWFDWNDWSPIQGTQGTVVTVVPGRAPAAQAASERINW